MTFGFENDEASVKRLTQRSQQTLAGPAQVEGTGFITGRRVRLRFVPAPPGAGIAFVRTDVAGATRIPADVDVVTGTQRRTTLGTAPHQVGLVEHVLAALRGLNVDNCTVELDAPEPPGMDGSALDFCQAILAVGIVAQSAAVTIWTVAETLLVESGDATLAIHPAETPDLRVSYLLDYGQASPIVPQIATTVVTPASFVRETAPCRTFLLEEEAAMLRAQGIGSNTTPRDLLVFGPDGPRDNALRFGNEPARHKSLDIVGDLALLGVPLAGHVVGYRSGHPLNCALAQLLRQRMRPVLPQQRRAA